MQIRVGWFLALVAFSWFKLRNMVCSLNNSANTEKFAKFVTRDREGEIKYVPNSKCAGVYRTLESTRVTTQGNDNTTMWLICCFNRYVLYL